MKEKQRRKKKKETKQRNISLVEGVEKEALKRNLRKKFTFMEDKQRVYT